MTMDRQPVFELAPSRFPIGVRAAAFYWRVGPRLGRKWLAKTVCARLRSDSEAVVVLRPYPARAIVGLNDPQCMYAIAYGGTLERRFGRLVLGCLSEGDVFVDVGANFGYYTLQAACIVGERGRVIGIEPQKNLAQRLKRSASLNGFSQVSVEEVAIGEQEGTKDLKVPTEYLSGIASFYDDNVNIVDASYRDVSVKVVTLDALLVGGEKLYVQAIKIDVEGFELSVLNGATALLESSNPPALFMEIFAGSQDARARSLQVLKRRFALGYRVFSIGEEGSHEILSVDTELADEQNVCAFIPSHHGRLETLVRAI